ncbi:peptidoglycan-binding domain-containing protein [Streptomyces mesophilus]|uniref:peptidoglycan-binding domain-containing protein n=1 Tax=Streptomyces mesophilus TaxID=1775132 RepID=UPI003330869F
MTTGQGRQAPSDQGRPTPPDESDQLVADPGEETSPSPRRRHPLRTSGLVLLAITVAAAGVMAATGAFGGDSGEPAATSPTGPPNTTEVRRTTLTRTESVDGSLGYGTAEPVTATGSSGILTWLPEQGAVLKRGSTVYSVNEQKTPLLYGSTPLYRPLAAGADGKDVAMLEANLAALGYGGFTVDDTFTEGTAQAVRDWQDDLDREETGEVGPGDAVVATGQRRVAEVKATRGGAAAGQLLMWTGSARIVSVELEVRHEDLVEKGTQATVALPDGTSAPAVVDEVAAAATAAPAPTGGTAAVEDATLAVTLTVKDQKKLGRYQAAPVDVTFRAETREDVLAVPINALVALREGGYALETIGAKGIAYVPVELGIFAGGMVEVSGPGVKDGLVVGVPK